MSSPQESNVAELTVRVIILGVVLSIVMGAANVYLGLKVGMTVSASIPAAVIGMLILRKFFRNGTILEANPFLGRLLTGGLSSPRLRQLPRPEASPPALVPGRASARASAVAVCMAASFFSRSFSCWFSPAPCEGIYLRQLPFVRFGAHVGPTSGADRG